MKAFGMEIKKQDVRDIYAELGKEIKEGLSLSEFIGIMTSRMVNIYLFRVLAIQSKRSSKCLSFLMKTISIRLPSKIWRELLLKSVRKFQTINSRKWWSRLIEMEMECSTSMNFIALCVDVEILLTILILMKTDIFLILFWLLSFNYGCFYNQN